MALFGGAGDGRREPRSLVEFRAGKMTLNNGTVTADTRKGLVYMKTSDSLLHFCWKDRQTGEVADVSDYNKLITKPTHSPLSWWALVSHLYPGSHHLSWRS